MTPLQISEMHDLLSELVAIGAPSFRESARGDFIENWLRQNTKADVGRDEIGNVWADLSNGSEPVHLLDAHIDTVFSFERVEIRREGEFWRAPGILDNTATVALLMLWVQSARRELSRPILASFSVGEENEGNLRGIKAIAARFGSRLRDAVVLDLRLDAACRQNVGSARFGLQWQAQGGHSWNDFGQASAIHAMASWISQLQTAFEWQNGRNSFNVGAIEGGKGATSLAETASLKLDVRSIEPQFLEEFRDWMKAQIETSGDGIKITQTSILERPAGFIGAAHPLVSLLESVHGELDLPLRWDIYSTNANALHAAGIPAITTGLSRGGGIHTEGEYLEIASLPSGWRKLQRLAEKLQTP